MLYCTVLPALAQVTESSTPKWQFGAFAHAGWNWHDARFLGLDKTHFPQIPYLPWLENMRLQEDPLSWNAGALAEYLLLNVDDGHSLTFGARLGVQSLQANFSSASRRFPIFSSSTANATLNFTLQTSALMLTAEPLITWRFAGKYAAVMAGVRFVGIFSETNLQRMSTTPPALLDTLVQLGVNPDNRSSLNISPFPNNLATVLTFGASYQFPLTSDGALLLAPEVFYSYPLTNIANNLAAKPEETAFWRVSTLRAGVALTFVAKEEKRKDENKGGQTEGQNGGGIAGNTASNQMPTSQALKPLQAHIAAVEGIERDGRRIPNPTLKIEEFLGSSSRYLLPFVFFGKQSAALPERYTQYRASDVAAFAPETLLQVTFQDNHELDAYYNMLNIIGYRMRKYAAARLTLAGSNDAANETQLPTLGAKRAEAVKEYICTVWGIAGSRIATRSVGTRGTGDAVDAEENRAVEIESSQPEILDELRFDYTHRATDPPRLEFTPEITAPEGLLAWSMAMEGRGITLAERHKQTQPTPLRLADFNGAITPKSVTWGVERSLAKLATMAQEPLRTTLRAADNARQSSEASVRIPTEILTIEEKQRRNAPDVRIGTYWVFCFDLNSKQILVDERVRRAVKAIRTHITPGASVEIAGYADTRGNVERNRKLSDERAEAVLQILGVPSSKIASVEGRGESTLYDNDLPEGRLYNRFVRVDVRTPLERK